MNYLYSHQHMYVLIKNRSPLDVNGHFDTPPLEARKINSRPVQGEQPFEALENRGEDGTSLHLGWEDGDKTSTFQRVQ